MKDKYNIAFNTNFVSSLTGASIAQLNTWDKQKIVCPSILKADGKGSIRLYSYEDIVEAKTVFYLRTQNHSLSCIKRAVEYLKKNYDYARPLKEASLISNGRDIILTDRINECYTSWVSANKSGQTLMEFVVPFSSIILDINKAIEHYNKRIESAEKQKKAGTLIPLESVREKYFGISNKSDKRSLKRRLA
ncbi:MAG: MerR family transcriptional regulator [Candidatus Gastranaerophilaceae bacterium]